MGFIKVGDRIINLDQVVRVERYHATLGGPPKAIRLKMVDHGPEEGIHLSEAELKEFESAAGVILGGGAGS